MPEGAGDRAATGSASNGAGSAELAQLRQLLIGQELDQVATIQDRLDDPAKRSADIAQVLPDAIRGVRAKALREALEPILEKSFENSVRKHTKVVADAIYPVIGPAIRRSIAAAIREFAEALNLIIEKSASFRAIRWRIEAILTGRPFSEILLSKSLLYSVEQVFLIHRKSGLLLLHVAPQESVLKDADMISGMLTAIQDFFSDSFTQGGQDLETVDTGRFKLWIQYGPKALLAGAVSGSAPVELKGVFRNALDKVHEILYAELDTFKQGDTSVFEPARPYLNGCLLGHSGPRKRKPILQWLVVTALILLLAWAVAFRIRDQSRWDHYFALLKQQPGIVVTGIEKHGSRYVVAGLRDPKTPDPAELLRTEGLDAGRVAYKWQPYLSLNTRFAEDRDLDAAKEQIEHQIIRFEVGSSKLLLADTDRIEALASKMKQLLQAYPNSRIAVTGHTDEVGDLETNSKLSMDRARRIIGALSSQGVAEDRLEPFGAGNAQPLRTGGTDWDRASNRSVSFRIAIFGERAN